MRYCLIKKLSEETGYTEKAIRSKIEQGVWLEGVHYRRAPDGRIHFNRERIERWIEGINDAA